MLTLVPRVHLAPLGGPEADVASSSAADEGVRMRVSDGQYLFNLSTKRSTAAGGGDLTPGTYRLWVTSPEIAPAEVLLDLRR